MVFSTQASEAERGKIRDLLSSLARTLKYAAAGAIGGFGSGVGEVISNMLTTGY
jgi:cell division GTPase FtsZ